MSNIGTLTAALWENRDKRRQLEAKIKELNEQFEPMEQELITLMQAEGVTSSRSTKGTVSIRSTTRYSIADDTAFYNYIQKHKAWHLLERRPSSSGYNELFEMKGATEKQREKLKQVLGVEPYTKLTINLLTAKGA